MDIAGDTGLDFKSQFYNLQGIHIHDRKRNLNKLLSSVSPDLPQDQIKIQPRNYQERIFYVDVLIYFKQVEKLIEVLKEGVGVLTSKILKQRWFFQEAFKDMSEENIINNFLPSLPYFLRMKVLKKMSLAFSEERMDKIFDLLLERYGLFTAKQFLFSCSPTKIIDVLRNNEITLLSEQLKRILQKDIEVLKVYFEEYKKNSRNDFNDTNFLKYLAWKHPNLYYELELDKKSAIKLGCCTTRAIIKTNKENVLKDVKDSRWNKAALVKEVKDFDKEHLHLFFPENIEDLNHYNMKVVKSYVLKYPIKKRWEVFLRAFKQAYDTEIVEHLDKFDEGLAKFFPKEIQEKWAEIRYPESYDLQYIQYYDAKKAFQLMKDKINVTSDIYLRGRFLNEIIIACHHNKDYSTYEAALKYICIRHRNDDANVRSSLTNHIASHIDYDLVTENHWQYINEIIDIQRVRGENLPFEIMAHYLVFVYRKGHPLDEPVTQYINDCIKITRSFRLLPSDKEMERNLLKHILRILPTLKPEIHILYNVISDVVDFNRQVKNDKLLNTNFKTLSIDLNEYPFMVDFIKNVCRKKDPFEYSDYKIVESLVCYNYLYSENPIKVIDEDELLKLIKTILEGDHSYYVEDSVVEIITKSRRCNFENNLLDCYFKEQHSHSQERAIKHFLAEEPDVIAKYFNKILDLAIKHNVALDYGTIKKYSHLEFDKQLISRFKDCVTINSKYEKKTMLLGALSKVMDTKCFLDTVQDYTPTTIKLDLFNQEQREIYQVQCDIAKAFKNLDEPAILAPVIMHFAQGDYLQSSLPILYRVFYRISEEKTKSYIKILEERAVSARKHAVFLSFKLLAFKDAVTICTALCNKETNVSSKKYLFSALLKFFLQNPVVSLLDPIFLNMKFVDKNDTEMITTMAESVDKVPNKNKPLFTEKVWDFLDFVERDQVKVISFRNTVLQTINENGVNFVARLNSSFCKNLIESYFLPHSDVLLNSSSLDSFVINYLLAYVDQQHFEFIFNKLKIYKLNYWGKDKGKIALILSFFDHTYAIFDQNDFKFLNLFKKFWQEIFSLEEALSECTLLQLMILYKENKNIENFSKEVDALFRERIGEFGPYIKEFLFNAIQTFFWNISVTNNPDFNLRNFALYLLKSNCSEFNCFAAYSIIKGFPKDNEIVPRVLDILKAVDSGIVRIYCNMLLKRR